MAGRRPDQSGEVPVQVRLVMEPDGGGHVGDRLTVEQTSARHQYPSAGEVRCGGS